MGSHVVRVQNLGQFTMVVLHAMSLVYDHELPPDLKQWKHSRANFRKWKIIPGIHFIYDTLFRLLYKAKIVFQFMYIHVCIHIILQCMYIARHAYSNSESNSSYTAESVFKTSQELRSLSTGQPQGTYRGFLIQNKRPEQN